MVYRYKSCIKVVSRCIDYFSNKTYFLSPDRWKQENQILKGVEARHISRYLVLVGAT
jgi:hypothetical protein